MRYRFIEENRSSFPVVKMCQTFGISTSGFYHWRKGPVSPRKIENRRLRQRIKELYHEHRGMAGSPMITADLKAEPDFSNVGKNRVARHMRAMGLRCKTDEKIRCHNRFQAQ